MHFVRMSSGGSGAESVSVSWLGESLTASATGEALAKVHDPL